MSWSPKPPHKLSELALSIAKGVLLREPNIKDLILLFRIRLYLFDLRLSTKQNSQ